ncbi:integrase domain-containing protein [Shewanella xiamenensis]|uniref:integrase domain-containing protein n=1 Tax=Shewanella xiamenensis TaxID=332186 RepID=UPI001186575A|nr:integrase domain-containing protein [Shewanella xiamenensis]TVL32936.1 integrase [Shewanella xiamenensis]
MCARATRLSDKEIKSIKPDDKDKVLSDGDGLQLRVRCNGSKLWNFNYRHPTTKARINIGLGTYPEISLAQARQLTLENRALVAQGIDPKEHRSQKRLEEQSVTEHTLFNVASQWIETKKHSVTADYATDIWRSFERHVFPKLKDMPISKITSPMIIELFRPIEASGSLETVKRLTQRLNEVMVFAVNCGLIFANPLVGVKAGFKKPVKENMATLKPEELPELMLALANASIKRTTRCLIEWQLHTMTRPSEAASTRWDEFNFEEKTWTIPAEKMKKRRVHTIPLTEQMLALLETMKPISGHRPYVFPSDRNPLEHCNSQTANMALKRMGFANRLVSHGLRSLASTTLNEQGFEPDLIESALAHVDSNQVRTAYNRTDFLERRRPMMSWWSNYIVEVSKGNVSLAHNARNLRLIAQ